MTGTELYDKKYQDLAEKLIETYSDIPVLADYYYYILTNMSYSSAYSYLDHVKNFILYLNGKDISEISLSDYTKYIAAQKKYTASYSIAVYSALKRFSKFLEASNICTDYMAYVDRPKFKEARKTIQKREKKYMSEEEIRDYLSAILNGNRSETWKQRDYTIALLFLTTGIRCSALQKLDVKDVDLKKKIVYVAEKGEKVREIPLSTKMVYEIEKWLKIKDAMETYDDALFVSKLRKRMTTQSIYNMITEYGKSVDEKIITPHALRATYGTNLYNKTNDLYLVQDCMGHRNPKTTEIYIRGVENKNRKAASKIIESVCFMEG
jgi:integrase/recombinase XerC